MEVTDDDPGGLVGRAFAQVDMEAQFRQAEQDALSNLVRPRARRARSARPPCRPARSPPTHTDRLPASACPQAAAKANQGSDEAGPSGTAGVAGLSAALAAELEDLGEDELGDDDDDEVRSVVGAARYVAFFVGLCAVSGRGAEG